MRGATRVPASFLLLLAATAFPAFAGEPTIVPLSSGESLSFELPAGWKATHNSSGNSLSVRITMPPSEPFILLMTVVPVDDSHPDAVKKGLEEFTSDLRNRYLASAMDHPFDLKEMANPDGIGYHCHITDKEPERGPHDYRESELGTLKMGDMRPGNPTMIRFTILSHPGDPKSVDQALDLLNKLRIVPAAKTGG
jgi:hypothetical protein